MEKKKPYMKPKLTQVDLRPEEAVLGGCKTAGITGPAQASCTGPTTCSTVES